MPIGSIIGGFIGRVAGDFFLKASKKFWNNYLNNPSSKLYHVNIRNAVKHFWFMFKILVVVKFMTLLFRLGFGRTISKETSFKLIALLVLVVLSIIIIPIWQSMERKKREAEPVLF